MKIDSKPNAKGRSSTSLRALLVGFVNSAALISGVLVSFIVAYSLFLVFIPHGSWINIISGESMDPTLHNRQIVFSDFGQIQRGDVVTLTIPEDAPNSHLAKNKILVKRVIGLPGDKILITQAHVYVNDIVLEEHYLTDEAASKTYDSGMINCIELSDNEYFVMGDNRGASYDSRTFGAISADCVCYKQSTKPTARFYLSILISLLIFGVTCCVHMLVENGVTKLAHKVLPISNVNAQIDNSDNSDNSDDNDTDNNVDNLKGEDE